MAELAGWLAQWPARSRKVRSEPPVLPLMFVPAVNHIIESISRIRQCSFPCVPRTRMTRLPGCRRVPARQSGYANSARLSPTTSHPRMRQRTGLAIALAAGEGTRMRSTLPKVLHPLGGRPLIEHVLAAAARACGTEIAVVVGPDHDAVAAAARRIVPCAQVFEQRERRGTADAVLAAKQAIAQKHDDILVIFADTPLVRAETLAKLRGAIAEGG